jgi:uncharacterized LabA/DUF88 family protein
MGNEYIEKLRRVTKGRTTVYVDAANLEQSVKRMWVNPKDVPDTLKSVPVGDLCWSVDYAAFHVFFRSVGILQGVQFYTAAFDSDAHKNFLYFLKKRQKFKLITKPLKEYRDHTPDVPHRKANFDVEIAVDATHALEQFDTFILFSGDCDFEYLIKFLRGRGKIVLGFSRSGHVAKELPPALTHYFDIIDFRQEFLRVRRKYAKNPAPDGTGSRS